MTDTVVCPKCGEEFRIDEILSAKLRGELRRELESEKRKQETELNQRATALDQRESALRDQEKRVEELIQSRWAAERERLKRELQATLREEVAVELKDAQGELEETRAKLKAAQAAELEVRKKARELEERSREFDLTLARQLDLEREKIREAARKEEADKRMLADAEKDKLISDLKRQISELNRKSEQGSQQLQGEVMELMLEDLLQRQFPRDDIMPVDKGVRGADVLQRVRDRAGEPCGTILWESKRTKNWSDSWLPKLRDDLRSAKAQLAVIVSAELPKGVSLFEEIDGVWVTSWPCAMALGCCLRASLVEVARAKRAADGKQGKMELLYNYLSGEEFRHRVGAILESWETLARELEAEKAAMQRIWARRQKQLQRALDQTAGMYGDLEGIIETLPVIDRLELPALEAPRDGGFGTSSGMDGR